MTRVRLASSQHMQRLLETLQGWPDCVFTQIDDDHVEISLLGSLAADAHRMELALRLRVWQAANPDVDVTFVMPTRRETGETS